jgi:hypothetical protein
MSEESLLNVLKTLDRDKVGRLIPDSDLRLIAEGKDKEVSRNTLLTIKSLQTDLGAGEFLDLGTSVAGAIAGAQLGAVGGPIGSGLGGLIGGAVGAFGGEVVEDLLAGREIQAGFEKGGAAREAANSALWDGVFLGAGKIVKGIGNALDIDPGRLLGIVRSQDKTPEISKISDNFDKDSVEGLRAINDYLISKGGGLTGFQTGQSGGFGKFIEGIANIGTLSSTMMSQRTKANARILDDVFNNYIDNAALANDDLGRALSDISEAGRRSTRVAYTSALNGIKNSAGNKTVSTANIANAIKSIEAETLTLLENSMSPEALKILRDRGSVVGLNQDATGKSFITAKTADVNSLIEYQKTLTRITEDAKPSVNNPGSDSLHRELKNVEIKVKNAIQKTLNDLEPNIGNRYREANKAYGEAMQKLRPNTISKQFARAANEESYTALGKVVFGKQAEDIKKLMDSVDAAFVQIGTPKSAITQGVKSASEAKKLIRRSYLAELFKGGGNVVENEGLSKLANRFKSETDNKVAKEIFGEEFGQFKFMLGSLEKITTSASPEFMALSIRGKEIGTLSNFAQVGGAGALAGAGGTLGALAIFAVPAVLARVSLSKTASQRMLKLANDVGRNPDRSPEIIAAQVAKILEALPDNDRDFISNLGL